VSNGLEQSEMNHDDSSLDQGASPACCSGNAEHRAALDELLKNLEQRGWTSFGNSNVKMLYDPHDPDLSVWVNLKTAEEYLSPKLLETILRYL
jgi:hypothetical protein